jgi:hypothetical protein
MAKILDESVCAGLPPSDGHRKNRAGLRLGPSISSRQRALTVMLSGCERGTHRPANNAAFGRHGRYFRCDGADDDLGDDRLDPRRDHRRPGGGATDPAHRTRRRDAMRMS